MTINDLSQIFTYFLAMLFALTFHEAAHAFAANFLGDKTAKSMGRLSLNPAVHMDMIGTLAFPLMCSAMGAPFIGWAKPVPYDERNFKNPNRDSMLTAAAGPISNLIFGFICLLFLELNNMLQWSILTKGQFLAPLTNLIAALVYVNGILAFLNLIPLPPLDGAKILRAFVNRDLWDRYEAMVAPYGFMIFLMLAYLGGLNWIGGLTDAYVRILQLLTGIILNSN
jgi:Zn-dependent protease